MTPRQRLLTVLNHKIPDKLPLDLGGTATSTITVGAYLKLRQFLNLPQKKPEIVSRVAQTVKPDLDFLEYFKIDTRSVWPYHPRDNNIWNSNVNIDGQYEKYYDEWGTGFRRPINSGLYYDSFYYPLAGDKGEKDINSYKYPEGNEKDRIKGLKEQCEQYREKGYPVIFAHTIGYGIMSGAARLMGYNDYLTKLLLEPKVIDNLSEHILETKKRFWNMVLNELGELIDVAFVMDDLGTQRGPFISPEVYRNRIKPYHNKLISFIKSKSSNIKIFFHSDGSVIQFIPDLIEIGVDVLNPVQLTTKGMDPFILKKEFGKDICFWGGGIDTQNTLPKGSIKDIKKEVRKNITMLSKGGGYIFAAVHNIQDDVPPQNILAAFDTVNRF